MIRGLRLGWLVALGALAIFALAPPLAARSLRIVHLAVGDYFRAIGPNGFNGIICARSPSAVPVKSIECYVASPAGVRPLSYSGFITACTTAVFRYDADGRNPHRVVGRSNGCAGALSPAGARRVYRTRESSHAGAGRSYKLHVGDTAFVNGTAIHCTISPTAAPRGSVECYLHAATRSGVRWGTYSVFLAPSSISIYRYLRSRRNPVLVYRHREPAR